MKAGRKFIDALRIFVKAGSGGNGLPKYGGIGGKGGDVYVKGLKDISLLDTRASITNKIIKAAEGEHSRQHNVIGESGVDLDITIPCGTTIHTEHGKILGEVLNPGEKVLIARGGEGGNQYNHFMGQKGEMHRIQLFLKLIADIGLVGFPNAGKSTLLRAISHAKPKIANYPFTTLHPTLGMIKYDDSRVISMADLPGLIEGAWCNTGMGHKFLRHVERTKVLVFVVDVQGFRLGPQYPYRSAIENVILLNKELELYKPELVEKPSLLLINKMDKPNATEKFEEFKVQLRAIKEYASTMPEEMQPERFVKFDCVIPCSAKKDRESINIVKNKIRIMLDCYSSTLNDNELHIFHKKLKSQLYETNAVLSA